MDCKEIGCKLLSDVREFVYGKNPGDDVRAGMLKLVPKSWVWKFVLLLFALVVPLVGVGYRNYSKVEANGKTTERLEKASAKNTERSTENSANVRLIQNDIGYINGNIDAMKTDQANGFDRIEKLIKDRDK